MAGHVIFLRPFPLEHCFCLPIAELLFPVPADRIALVVADHGTRVEAERPAMLLEPPACVYVVAGRTELRVEAADSCECLLPERHVASRNVLRLAVGQKDVDRSARCMSHAACNPPVIRRGNVPAAQPSVCRRAKGFGEEPQPLRVGPRISIDVCDDVSGRGLQARVPGEAQSPVWRPNESEI